MVSYQLLWPRLTFHERKQVTDLAFREAQHGQILRRQTRRGHCEKKCERIKNNDCWFAGKLNRGMRDEFGKQQSARDETRKYYDY